MMQLWRLVAGISGASAIGVGAYGAHGFKPKDKYYKEVYQRANLYHLLHSLLLATVPIARRPNIVGGLTVAGISLFCGSCYAVALKEDRSVGKLAPYGGMALMAAWLALAL